MRVEFLIGSVKGDIELLITAAPHAYDYEDTYCLAHSGNLRLVGVRYSTEYQKGRYQSGLYSAVEFSHLDNGAGPSMQFPEWMEQGVSRILVSRMLSAQGCKREGK